MGDLTIEVKDDEGKPIPGATVHLEQQSHDFWFGTALADWRLSKYKNEPAIITKYKEVVRTHFNAAVHEDSLKWYYTERARGSVSYRDADEWVKWCEENGIRMRGHCLFWEKEDRNLQWVRALDRESLRQAVERRAKEVTARYRGRIVEYDVNNEMLHGNFFRSRLGGDIIGDMFRWAKEGDPNATLYVNEYLPRGYLPRYEGMIRSLLERGVPVGGIGIQAHFGDGPGRIAPPTPEEWKTVLDSLAKFGLPIKITEYSYDTPNEERKALFLADFYRLCFSHPAVEGILMWGFWEGAIWRPGAAIFDLDFSPRPAARIYRKLVYGEWWTNATGLTDAEGRFKARAFFGRYNVTVITPDGRMAKGTFSFPRAKNASVIGIGVAKRRGESTHPPAAVATEADLARMGGIAASAATAIAIVAILAIRRLRRRAAISMRVA
ncbi:MAG: endo-1,4-beta-xylanase [Candidatus Bathyarchaeia archaeon]